MVILSVGRNLSIALVISSNSGGVPGNFSSRLIPCTLGKDYKYSIAILSVIKSTEVVSGVPITLKIMFS